MILITNHQNENYKRKAFHLFYLFIFFSTFLPVGLILNAKFLPHLFNIIIQFELIYFLSFLFCCCHQARVRVVRTENVTLNVNTLFSKSNFSVYFDLKCANRVGQVLGSVLQINLIVQGAQTK